MSKITPTAPRNRSISFLLQSRSEKIRKPARVEKIIRLTDMKGKET